MEFDVQLTKDLEPVIYHDLMISLNVAPVSCYVTRVVHMVYDS